MPSDPSQLSDSVAEACDFTNRLLSSLPNDVHASLRRHLQVVHLARTEVVVRAYERLRFVFFPCSAVVSLVSELESGDTLEVGLVGRDGLVGTAILPGFATMPCDAIVQIPGDALRMSADRLRREVTLNEALHSRIARFAQVLFARSMQISLCNMFHPVEQRCIRWLLCVHDLAPGNEVPLTHELLATMLGVRRSTITRVIQALDRRGLIDERRGRLTVRDRGGLEAACCECYGVMRDEQKRLLGL